MAGKKILTRTLLVAVLLFLGACASHGPQSMGASALMTDGKSLDASYAGKNVAISRGSVSSSMLVPDGAGGFVLLPGSGQGEDKGYVDARELRLKIRELGEQLAAGMDDCGLQATVAMPTSFVELGDFDRTSPLGRLMAEQLYHEFHQRGYAVREYRMPGSVRLRKREGEFALSRNLGNVAASSGSSVVVVGTYEYDKDAIFVNARLVRPKDKRVLRTASMTLRSNDLTRRMARGGSGAKLDALAGKGMRIKDFDAAMRPPKPAVPLNPFDRGEDIH